MRDKRKRSTSGSARRVGANRGLLSHLMPASTLGQHSNFGGGDGAKGGFMSGIPAGGGGGVAAALAGASGAGVGGPHFGDPVAAGIAPPPPFTDLPPGLPGPTLPPVAPPLSPAQQTPQTGLFPTQPTTPFIAPQVGGAKPAPPPGSQFPRFRFF